MGAPTSTPRSSSMTMPLVNTAPLPLVEPVVPLPEVEPELFGAVPLPLVEPPAPVVPVAPVAPVPPPNAAALATAGELADAA